MTGGNASSVAGAGGGGGADGGSATAGSNGAATTGGAGGKGGDNAAESLDSIGKAQSVYQKTLESSPDYKADVALATKSTSSVSERPWPWMVLVFMQ